MNANIEQCINSGILEAFVIGAATPAEEREILQLKEKHPEVRQALFKLETDLEALAQSMAIMPPPNTWDKIEAEIDGIIAREKTAPNLFTKKEQAFSPAPEDSAPNYINVESESNHMRIHKAWRWVFAAVFILGKIFLATAIYYYLENRQAQSQIKDLKSEIHSLK
jgi:hypothetical protein